MVTLTLTDLSGRALYRQAVQVQAGVNVLEIPEVKKLSAGTYLLTMFSQQQNSTIRILKAR